MDKTYKIDIDYNKCTKCGMCSTVENKWFTEDNSGVVRVKNKYVKEDEYTIFQEVKSYCLSNAIKIENFIDVGTKLELIAKVKTLLNVQLGKIKTSVLENKDFMLSSDEIKVNLNFSTIYSNYKFRSSEDAMSSGVIKFNNVIEANEKIVLKSALIDYQVKKINRFINRDDFNFFFRKIESEVNSIFDEIKASLELLTNVNLDVDMFQPELDKMPSYSYIKTFSEYDDFSTNFKNAVKNDYYVDYDWVDDKYRYIIKSESIKEYFEDMIWGVFSDTIEKVFERNIKDYINEYNSELTRRVSEFKRKVSILLDSLSLNDEVINTNYKNDLKRLLDDFIIVKDAPLIANRGYINTMMDDYDYVYKSFNRAWDVGKRRLDTLEKDTIDEFSDYLNRLASKYTETLIEQIENLLIEIQNLYAISNIDLVNKNVRVDFDEKLNCVFVLNDSKVREESRKSIEDRIKYILRDELEWTFKSGLSINLLDIESTEVYLGDGLFGNMKFGERYCYKIDRTKFNEEISSTYEKINEKAFGLQLLNKYRNKLKIELEKTLL